MAGISPHARGVWIWPACLSTNADHGSGMCVWPCAIHRWHYPLYLARAAVISWTTSSSGPLPDPSPALSIGGRHRLRALARHTVWRIPLDTAIRCSYTRVIRSCFATAIIVSGTGPEGKGDTAMSPGRTTLVNTLSAIVCLPERCRFLVRPQRLTRRSSLPVGRDFAHFMTDRA
jgi:hypothetical protein